MCWERRHDRFDRSERIRERLRALRVLKLDRALTVLDDARGLPQLILHHRRNEGLPVIDAVTETAGVLVGQIDPAQH